MTNTWGFDFLRSITICSASQLARLLTRYEEPSVSATWRHHLDEGDSCLAHKVPVAQRLLSEAFQAAAVILVPRYRWRGKLLASKYEVCTNHGSEALVSRVSLRELPN